MGEFLTFAYELLRQIFLTLAGFFVGVGKAFLGLFTGAAEYWYILKAYAGGFNAFQWILTGLLLLVLAAILVLIVYKIVLAIRARWQRSKLEVSEEDLLGEIAGLNRQVADLISEKSQILSMKVSQLGLTPDAGEGESDSAEGTDAAGGKPGQTSRFAKLTQVDEAFADKEAEQDGVAFDREITLPELVERYRCFAASRMKLYYDARTIRMYLAGMAASKILILEGISGTGKTSLPYSFSKFLKTQAGIVSVQPSFRDRTELIGYFNEFTKRFNETEFLRNLYAAGYQKNPCFIVLDEMNLARIEYYFAEMLSVLEMPTPEEWVIDLVPTAWDSDPKKLINGKILVPTNLWFVGTANNDDSTFTITDKVYDRAIPIALDKRCEPFDCPDTDPVDLEASYLSQLFAKAKEENAITDANLARLDKLDKYLQTRFKMAFGNRILKQMREFVPAYVACGGTEMEAMDYIVERKILKKFESMNVAFVRDEIKELISFVEKTFGKNGLTESKKYLQKLQTMF